jgi:hypothetical protein
MKMARNAEFVTLEVGGTYSNRCALKSYNLAILN